MSDVRIYHRLVCMAVALATACLCAGANLTALPEHLRPDPFGAIVEPDRPAWAAPSADVVLESARAAYASCHIVATIPEGGRYELELQPFPVASGIQAEVYREWFHYLPSLQRYLPDALIPVPTPYRSQLPEPDNRIPKQTAQAFWLDVWVPRTAEPGAYQTTATLHSGGKTVRLPIKLRVLAAVVPPEDAIAIDHNSYGTYWLADQYPALAKRLGEKFFTSDEFFGLIHSYHGIFYEHRGVFHQLGYGHAGKVGPEFAPRLEGSGKRKHVADWTLFDRHYGPLLDGSAFAATHRGRSPIPFVYLPINPEWPASFLWWGEPGYEREFVNVVSEMERHFREKGWTATRFELFFNHKKRYKGFPWDGDEVRFVRDYSYFKEYARLWKQAVPADSPVKFVFRADVSWTMERQFKELAGIVNFWVCGGGEFGWYDYAPKLLKDRGDIVWIYGGTPPVTEPSSHVTVDVLRPWLWGIDGFVHWQTAAPGDDPWFHSDGGGEALVYPGDRFGIEAPIPSIRLKIQRNAVQDVTLLESFSRAMKAERLKADVARRFNDTALDEWRTPRPPMADRNPEDVSNADYEDAMPKNPKFTALDAAAWQRVHSYTLQVAREAR
jgi:hypothetical protein